MMVAYEKDGRSSSLVFLMNSNVLSTALPGIGASQAAVNEIVEHVHDDKYRIVYHELVYSEFFYFVDEFCKYLILEL